MNLTKSLGPWLGKTSKMIGCLISEKLQENSIDLTREQWLVLVKLNQNKGLSQSKLAFISDRDKTSLTRLISTMERKKLVIRKISTKDKRVKLVHLTNFGMQELSKSMPIVQNIIQDLQKGLSQKEINTTINILQKLQENLTVLSTNCGGNQ